MAFPPLAAVLFALALVMPAWAATVTNITVPISGTVSNACNGEMLTFSGELHLTSRVTLDSSGGFHLGAHVNIHVTATGDQGNTYEGNQEDNSELNGRIGVEQIETITISIISKGSAPNVVIHAVFHITVRPDGTVTAFVDHLTAECRG
jgi:hypothetical protein